MIVAAPAPPCCSIAVSRCSSGCLLYAAVYSEQHVQWKCEWRRQRHGRLSPFKRRLRTRGHLRGQSVALPICARARIASGLRGAAGWVTRTVPLYRNISCYSRAGRIDLLPVPFSGMSCCRQASRAFTVVAFICIVTHLVSLALMYFRRVQGKVSSDDNLWDPEAPTRSLRLATESVDEEASFT